AMEAARQRVAAQQVPDMLAPGEPAAAAAPAQPQQSQSAPQATLTTGEAIGKPVVSGALTSDAGAPVIGNGGASAGKKVLVVLLFVMLALGAGAAGYYFLLR